MSRSCWICLSTEQDEAPGGLGATHNWRKICNCNLYAHEECLIHWALNQESEDKCCCPQCQTPVRIRKHNSAFLSLRQLFDKIVSGVFSGALTGAVLGGLGGAISAGAFAMLYGAGASYVNLLCSPVQAYRIFGPFMQSATAEGQFRPVGLSLAGFLRRALLIPQIPLALIASRSRRSWAGMYLTILPLLATSRIGPLQPFQRSLLLFVAVRYVHRLLYDYFVEGVLQGAAVILKGANADEEEAEDLEDEMRVFEEALAQAAVVRAPAAPPAENPLDEDLQQRIANLEVLLPDGEAAPNLDELRNLAGMMRNAFLRNRRTNRQPVVRAGTADWVLGTASGVKELAYPLLLPYAGVGVAKVLRLLPLLRSAPVLELNLAGSAIVVVIRDILNVMTAVYRVNQSETFRVLNYDEKDDSEIGLIERMARAITPLFQFEIQARFE